MSNKKWTAWLGLLVIAMLILSACQPKTVVVEKEKVVTKEVEKVVTQAVEKVVEKVVTKEVEKQIVATPTPVARNGAWVDTVVVVEEPNADAGVTRLTTGDIDVYAYTISNPKTAQKIKDAGLNAAQSYGSYNELTFNPATFTNGKLNPFVEPKIREAMNWVVDRDYIVQEIMGGLATPRYVAVNGASADRARLAAEIRAIEAKYAYNFDKGKEVITEEMKKLGAELVGGKWQYNGEPVEIIVLIRTEDERRAIGDYVANQLEQLGFTVVRDYKKAAEASPIWLRSDPAEGKFHVYTGGWVSTAISRDAGSNFQFFYTPAGMPRPLWQAYTPTPEFADLAQRLNDNDFKTLEERAQLFARALELSMEDSVRIWLVDRSSVAPYRPDVEVASDLSGSIYGARAWPYTLRRVGQVGGSIKWAMPSILTEAWNPIAGTNWIYDMALIRATGDVGLMPDPATGLAWPQRIEKAEVVVEEGLPVGKTLDWVSLSFAPKIEVPADAWADWDAAEQKFVTVGEKYGGSETAAYKSVVYYPKDLYKTMKWHDGSNFDLADVVMFFILQFDQAKPESPYYDEAQVPAFESFMSTFKGMRITSEDPLVIEWYSDAWQLDAELAVVSLWPNYAQGEGAWHTVALGLMAEEKKLSAFSPDKATALEVDQLNYISGPTVDILKQQLDEAMANKSFPYAATLSKYISPEEAEARYNNLSEFFRRRGHFWVGTGPFFLQRAFPVEGMAILERYADYPDPANKWDRFAAPALAEVDVTGPARVTINSEAKFDVMVDFEGKPYPVADIQEVKFLLFDAKGEMVLSGLANAVQDGQWQITLSKDVTSKLEAGSNRLEVVVVSKLVALPSLGTFQFVTVP